MAFLTIPNVKIVGLAAAVPKEKKDIPNLKCFAPGEAEKVMALTGITESRLAPEGMVCSDYCQAAAEKLIEDLGWEKESIDALVYLSVSRDYIERKWVCLKPVIPLMYRWLVRVIVTDYRLSGLYYP